VPQSHAPSLTARRCPSDAPARGRSGRSISTALARMATGRCRRRRRRRSLWSQQPRVLQSRALGSLKIATAHLLAVLVGDLHPVPATVAGHALVARLAARRHQPEPFGGRLGDGLVCREVLNALGLGRCRRRRRRSLWSQQPRVLQSRVLGSLKIATVHLLAVVVASEASIVAWDVGGFDGVGCPSGSDMHKQASKQASKQATCVCRLISLLAWTCTCGLLRATRHFCN